MKRKMIINATYSEEVRIATLNENGLLDAYDVETRNVEKNKGNIYKGIVKAVEPSLNAAFIKYGAEKEGFLNAKDISTKLVNVKCNQKSDRIKDLLKPGQALLVQIERDEVGEKGAALTTFLSLAGRFLVLMPGASRHGVSRQIEDEKSRQQLKELMNTLDVPDDMGIIIRTAGHTRNKTDLKRDLRVLQRLWSNLQKEADKTKTPALILKEQDVVVRAIRDYYTTDINEIWIDSKEAYERAYQYMRMVMPNQKKVLKRYQADQPIFHHYNVESQLDVLYSSRAPLPSGGSLVIEPTEALVAIDVNSGKLKIRDQEETALRTNMEAAVEAARQLRLRDLGGIVVIDFIDMMIKKNQRTVESTLRQALKRDKARIKLGRITIRGTIELTRQRLRRSLETNVFRTCRICNGTGHVLSPELHALSVLRTIRNSAPFSGIESISIRIDPEAGEFLRNHRIQDIRHFEDKHDIRIHIDLDEHFVSGHHVLFAHTQDKKTVPLEQLKKEAPQKALPSTSNKNNTETKKKTNIETTKTDISTPKKRPSRRRRFTGPKRITETPSNAEIADTTFSLPDFDFIDMKDFEAQNSRQQSQSKSSYTRRNNRNISRRQNTPSSITKPEASTTETKSLGKQNPRPQPQKSDDSASPNYPSKSENKMFRFLKNMFT